MQGDGDLPTCRGQAARDDPELRATWQTYHLVGDVLRSGAHAAVQRHLGIPGALPAAAWRPSRWCRCGLPVLPNPAGRACRVEAANEPVFRWKLVAGAASLAAAAAIGWNWVGNGAAVPCGRRCNWRCSRLQPAGRPRVGGGRNGSSPQPRGARRPRRVIGNGNPQVMLRDPRLDQLLEAHQQAGGASQMPSGFLRNATFERPSR